jgi:hypothetical protein
VRHLPGKDAQLGVAMYDDIYRRMVSPMQVDFSQGNREAGVGTFIDYVFNDPHAWANMSAHDRA